MSDLSGTTIGQYQIIEPIGTDGPVQIYKGFQPATNRYVSVWVLQTQDPAAAQRFTQQSEIIARFQHPNILPLIDSGKGDGLVYRVSLFPEGGSLQNRLFEYYDPRKAAGLFSGIVDGLAAIHAQGLVHGNLESGNIYLDRGGRPLLTDFGLPKPSGAPLTPYMSPEQTLGGPVDSRTDIYALGVLLYEVLTNELPPAGAVANPRAKRPDLPEALERVVFKAMAQDPNARFQSVTEFRNALNAAVQPAAPPQTGAPAPQAQPQQAAPPPPPAPAGSTTNWTAIILGVLLVLVLCVGAVFLYKAVSGDDGTVPPEATPTEGMEAPPTEAPPPTEPPAPPTEQPAPPTDDGDGTIGIPEGENRVPLVCQSGGFIGGFALFGGVLLVAKRKRDRIW